MTMFLQMYSLNDYYHNLHICIYIYIVVSMLFDNEKCTYIYTNIFTYIQCNNYFQQQILILDEMDMVVNVVNHHDVHN